MDYGIEVEEMLKEKVALQSFRSHSVMELIQNRAVRWQLLTIVVTFTALQLCGINAVSNTTQTRYLHRSSKTLTATSPSTWRFTSVALMISTGPVRCGGDHFICCPLHETNYATLLSRCTFILSTCFEPQESMSSSYVTQPWAQGCVR